MKTIEVNLFKFEELSEESQQRTLEKLWDINLDYDWWESTYEDAKNVGIKIDGFDIYRGYCKIDNYDSWNEVADKIISEHGDSCETYKYAKEFLENRDDLVSKYSDGVKLDEVDEDNEYDFDEELDELEEEFKSDLSNAYLNILRDDYEYRSSEEAIKESIIVNGYYFLEGGGDIY